MKTGHRELVILPGKGETLNPRQSNWLKGHPHRTLLSYDLSYTTGVQDSTLFYDIDGFLSLKSYLKRTRLNETTLARLLVDVALSQICCAKGEGRYFSMLFDTKSVFVDTDGHLSFVFIPLDGMAFRLENSPLYLLRALSDTKHLRFEDHNTQVLAKRLGEFVLNENEVFSLNSFREFIRTECWIAIDSDGRVERAAGSHVGSDVETDGDMGGAESHDDGGRGDDTFPSTKSMPYVFVRLARGERYPLEANSVVCIGRGSDCQVRIMGNPRIGRRHLALKCTEEGLVLQDLGSGNGTMIDGYRLDSSYAALLPYDTQFVVADEECLVHRRSS